MVDEVATTHEKWFRVEVYFCAFSGLFSSLLELFYAPMVVSGKHAADFTVILIVSCPFMSIH
jgi:hypothetical protein